MNGNITFAMHSNRAIAAGTTTSDQKTNVGFNKLMTAFTDGLKTIDGQKLGVFESLFAKIKDFFSPRVEKDAAQLMNRLGQQYGKLNDPKASEFEKGACRIQIADFQTQLRQMVDHGSVAEFDQVMAHLSDLLDVPDLPEASTAPATGQAKAEQPTGKPIEVRVPKHKVAPKEPFYAPRDSQPQAYSGMLSEADSEAALNEKYKDYDQYLTGKSDKASSPKVHSPGLASPSIYDVEPEAENGKVPGPSKPVTAQQAPATSGPTSTPTPPVTSSISETDAPNPFELATISQEDLDKEAQAQMNLGMTYLEKNKPAATGKPEADKSVATVTGKPKSEHPVSAKPAKATVDQSAAKATGKPESKAVQEPGVLKRASNFFGRLFS